MRGRAFNFFALILPHQPSPGDYLSEKPGLRSIRAILRELWPFEVFRGSVHDLTNPCDFTFLPGSLFFVGQKIQSFNQKSIFIFLFLDAHRDFNHVKIFGKWLFEKRWKIKGNIVWENIVCIELIVLSTFHSTNFKPFLSTNFSCTCCRWSHT